MLHKVSDLKGKKIHCTDEEFGTVRDTYIDIDTWTLRYIVVDTGGMMSGRQVIVSPRSVKSISAEGDVYVTLSRSQLEDAPTLEDNLAPSRAFEQTYFDYIGSPYYWNGPFLWGAYPSPMDVEAVNVQPAPPVRDAADRVATDRDHGKDYEEISRLESGGEPRMYSTKEVDGYHLRATDGEIGHVDDFVMDDQTWQVRYFIADTSNWWFGHKVLIDTAYVNAIDLHDRKVDIELTAEQIKDSPDFDDSKPIESHYADALDQHYRKERVI
jgi:sporulation protein YlmC with PRC-barrel domain